MTLELRCQPVLSLRAAVIEHMKEMYNVPSSAYEIAHSIGRDRAAVRAVIRKLVREGEMVRMGNRVMLTGKGHGAELLP